MSILKIAIGIGVFATVAVTSILYYKQQPSLTEKAPEAAMPTEAEIPAETADAAAQSMDSAEGTPSPDEALTSIVNNDQPAFENYINKGGKLSAKVKVGGKKKTVGELMVKYERKALIETAKAKAVDMESRSQEDDTESDVYSEAVTTNNPEILSVLIEGKADIADKTYGQNKRSLLHKASEENAVESTKVLHKAGMSWDKQAEDGSTPLTVAAESGSVETLEYWKKQGADFSAKDGRGKSALSIMKAHQKPEVVAFANSFSSPGKKKAQVGTLAMNSKPAAQPNFYKKRVLPTPRVAGRGEVFEPENRPDEANETADYSEFSD